MRRVADTPHGLVDITYLHVGDTALAENTATGQMEPQTVTAVIGDGVQPLMALALSDGSAIMETANHPFWVDAGADLQGTG